MAEYIPNDEAAELAEELIPQFHPRLVGLRIAHLMIVQPIPNPKKKSKKVPRQGKKVVMAKTSKVSAKTCALAEKDVHFVIEYYSNVWDKLSPETKLALVDHELCHCGNDADGIFLVNHTVEEFAEIIQRRGLWKSDLKDFSESVEIAYHA